MDLVFPRIMYRGAPDVLGRGAHPHPETGDLVGEAKKVDAHEYQDHVDAGWRLTREIPDVVDVVDEAPADESADKAAEDAEGGAKTKKARR